MTFPNTYTNFLELSLIGFHSLGGKLLDFSFYTGGQISWLFWTCSFIYRTQEN